MLGFFLVVPILSSLISMIHIVKLVTLGNVLAMGIALSVTFELGALVSFITLSRNIFEKIKKEYIYVVFIVLFILQAFGNVYASFDYMRRMLMLDTTWLDSFMEMTFNVFDLTQSKLVLSCLIGLPIPLISLIMLKSAIDYFYTTESGGIGLGATQDKPVVISSTWKEPNDIPRNVDFINSNVNDMIADIKKNANLDSTTQQESAPAVSSIPDLPDSSQAVAPIEQAADTHETAEINKKEEVADIAKDKPESVFKKRIQIGADLKKRIRFGKKY